MKPLVIPVVEEKFSLEKLNYFNPKSIFDADWSLDLHGYLTRDEFDTRLAEINHAIRNVPLLSKRIRTFTDWSYGITTSVMTFIFLGGLFTGGFRTGPIVSFVLEVLFSLGYIAIRLLVTKLTERRAKEFTDALNVLFKQYNYQDNPTANWKLAWRPVISHINIKMKSTSIGNVGGKATPKYASQAEIILEISDSLSDLTAKTVHFKLPPQVIREMTISTY
ncbi:8806_t:CDS:1 [Acaulospora morrowiae]|uniref:8806_t:CDS:1 n=1 Tax=Acaulospora morrowiae TaxID=94023 RepID=A0A9N9FYR8_9GLOM|nr:8806_t:CDS:1 [Acaulospora morrowiae]